MGVTPMTAPREKLPEMLEAQADLSRKLSALREQLAESRANADMLAFRAPAMEPYHSLASTQDYIDTHRPAAMPYWKAYMNVDASLTEDQARKIAFEDVKHKRGAAAPVSATAATATAAVGPGPGPDDGAPEAKPAAAS